MAITPVRDHSLDTIANDQQNGRLPVPLMANDHVDHAHGRTAACCGRLGTTMTPALRYLAIAVTAFATTSAANGCGGQSVQPQAPEAPMDASKTAQANLLLYPSSDPESLLGRAVHLTGHNAWTIADDRAPGCEVTVKRKPTQFRTERNVDLNSMTALAAGLPQLIGIEARYGRTVTADIEIDNTEVLEADVSPRCGDVVVDKVFVGSGSRRLVTRTEVGGKVGVQAGPISPSASHEAATQIVDTTEWHEPQGYGFGTRRMGDTPPLDLTVRLAPAIEEGNEVSVTIEASRKSWLVVFYQEGDGKASVLWPSAEEPEPTAEPGRPAVLPSAAERGSGLKIMAALREPGKAAHELFVVYAFTEKADYDRFKPAAGAEATDGPAYVSELTKRISDLPMARWSRAITAYTIRPKRE